LHNLLYTQPASNNRSNSSQSGRGSVRTRCQSPPMRLSPLSPSPSTWTKIQDSKTKN
jgi:hypothetical protein